MLIDWFTVGAQVLNFLILVWLLKRFLYRPVLDALDARERRIAAELADAGAKQTEAAAERDEFQRKNAEFEKQRTALLREARSEAEAERLRLLGEARTAANAMSSRQRDAMRIDARNLERAMGDWTRDEVFAIARRTLSELAAASLEERLIETFNRRLHEMDADAKTRLTHAFEAGSEPALVRSAFAMPAEQRAAVKEALDDTLERDVDVRFETAPEVITGIELVANGQKLAWSVSSYLVSLERGVDELLCEPRADATAHGIESASATPKRTS